MKRYLLPAIALFVVSCKKEKQEIKIYRNEVKVVTHIDSNGVKKTDSSVVYSRTENGKSISGKNEIKKFAYVYLASDGSQVDVIFTHYADSSYILIERNTYKIDLPQTKLIENGAIFEKDGIKAITRGDRLSITQNGQLIELTRKK